MRAAVLLMILFVNYCSAKQYLAINITRNDGLISDVVFDIYQDELGYVWFATDQGVSRYNGIKFENYTTNSGLADNTCYSFRRDFSGRLWIGTNNGELQFYKDGKFYSAKNTPFLKLPFKARIVNNIVLEKDSSLTIHFADRSKFISLKGDKLKCYDLKPLLMDIGSFNDVIDIVRNNSNSYSLLCTREVIGIDSGLSITSIKKYPNNMVLVKHVIGRDQEYYIDENNRYYNKKFQLVGSIPSGIRDHYSVNRIVVCNDKKYIASTNGLYIDSNLTFKNVFVTTVFIDKDSSYWISTSHNGVYRLNSGFDNSFKIDLNNNDRVLHARASGNKLYVSSFNRDFSIYTDGVLTFHFDCEKGTGLNYNGNLCGYFFDKENHFNLCSSNPYVIRGITSKKPIAEISKTKKSFNAIYAAKIDSNIYIADRSGVWKYPLKLLYEKRQFFTNNQTSPYWKKVHSENNVSPEYLFSLEENSTDKSIWYSTTRNVYKIFADTSIVQLQFSKYTVHKLVICLGYMLCITSDNKLFIINRFDKSTPFIIDSSLNGTCIWNNIVHVNDTTVLVMTNDYYRLITLRPSNGEPLYSVSVLDNPYIPQHADYFYSDKIDCYFFLKRAIYKLPVTELFKIYSPPSIFFTEIKSLARDYSIDSMLTLTFSESRDISIQYTSVSLHSNRLTYQYAITSEVSDKTIRWLVSDGENISLSNIGAGHYVINIRAITQNGTITPSKSFTLIILKPFWQTWWFITSVTILFIIIFLSIVSYIIRNKNIEKEKEIRFIQSEYRALNALMNPHFIFNSLNNVQGLINSNQKQHASEYLRVVSDLIRQNMYNVSGDFITLNKEIELIVNYLKLEKLRLNNFLDFEINIDDEVEIDLIKIPPLLIQPLVENAIKYGCRNIGSVPGRIHVNIYVDSLGICIDVIDNGKGFTKTSADETAHQSTALINIRRRMAQLSAMHQKIFRFSIEEMINADGGVSGVKASIRIE